MAGWVVMQAVGQPRSFRGSLSNALFSAYKRGLSPILHGVSGSMGACRFQPSCSEYAALAISYYGIFRGSWLALRRIAKCHPFHPPQFDPVPVPSHIAHPTLHAAPMQSSLPPVTIEQRAFADRAASSPPAELPDERR